MSLTKEQIQDIELYLEQKKLFVLDVKIEVLDHFANGIEQSMKVEKIGFLDAFEIERIKWENDFNIYTSFLFTHNELPKIVAKKWKKEEKKILVNSLFFTGLVTFLVVLFKTSLETKMDVSFLNKIIGYGYFIYLVFIAILNFKITNTGKSTTYRNLFKINFSGVFIWFFVFNPLWLNTFQVESNGNVLSYGVFMSAFVFCFSFSFLILYKKHKHVIKSLTARSL